MKMIVTTHPFGEKNSKPRELLKDYDVSYNSAGRKYKIEELHNELKKHNPDIIIAGTEKYDYKAFEFCPNLKMISRVGIGIDSVNLEECKKRNIILTNTPDAPSNAVAEMTICQMLNMLRKIQNVDGYMRKGEWIRHIGKEIRDCDVGIIGCGRVGALMVEKLQGLKPRRIFVNDLDIEKTKLPRCEYATKMQILSQCDIITIHIWMDENNYHFISKFEFDLMKPNAMIINTSRGGIINEDALFEWLDKNKDAKAAIDTFEKEPYEDELLDLKNVYLTPHMGSCTEKSRFDMEVGAVEEVINYLYKKKFNSRIV